MGLLDVQCLSIRYDDTVNPVVSDLSFSVDAGQSLGAKHIALVDPR